MTAPLTPLDQSKIAVIGLGYVGLPLAVEFAKQFRTVGFDISAKRIGELEKGIDTTLEVEDEDLQKVLVKSAVALNEPKSGFFHTDAVSAISSCNIFVITVPTPTDKHNKPVLTPMIKASETVGGVLKKGDVVIYESTVYPGVTEDECVPVLEKVSGMKFNEDFYV